MTVYYCRDFIYYENVYGNHTSKLLCLGFHILTSIITSPILYMIIKYEQNLNYRTLTNQMVSSVMWNALAYNLVVSPLTLLFYIISPINSKIICRIYHISFSVITFRPILLLDAMVLIRYLFIFHLKNPTAVQDDFWNFWINIWTFIFCLLSEIVIKTLPTTDNPRITICIGKVPVNQTGTSPDKFAVHLYIVLGLSLLIISGFGTINLIYRIFSFKKLQDSQLYQRKFFSTNKDNLFSFGTTCIAFALVFFGHAIGSKILSLQSSVLDSYPYYVMEYAHENLIPSGAILIYIISHLYLNGQVRKTIWMNIQKLTCCLD